ncbi:MAG TPA: glycosyl hydrolase-related protein, partial [Ktedonobacteraceae bacterium]|nr:glycosyl hydrolase-related protein [Ktedonobacteraceae bacterium]
KQSEAGDGVVVRVYNPLSHVVQATIRPEFACTNAFVTNLNEEPIGQLPGHQSGQQIEQQTGHPQGVSLHIEVRSGEIVTVLFK